MPIAHTALSKGRNLVKFQVIYVPIDKRESLNGPESKIYIGPPACLTCLTIINAFLLPIKRAVGVVRSCRMKLGVVELVSFRAQRLAHARIGDSFAICSFLVDRGSCKGHVRDIAASRVSNLPIKALFRSTKLLIDAD